jgi:hypothetical protein
MGSDTEGDFEKNSPLCVDNLSEDSLCPQKMKNWGWARVFSLLIFSGVWYK